MNSTTGMFLAAWTICASVASTNALAGDAADSDLIKSSIAKEILYAPASHSGYKWGVKHSSVDQGEGLVSLDSTSSEPTGWYSKEAFGSEVVEADANYWSNRSSADQSTYKWGIRSNADQSTYKWGIRSNADQSTYKWGIRSIADQSTYKWGIR
jgi:hypothetical protein